MTPVIAKRWRPGRGGRRARTANGSEATRPAREAVARPRSGSPAARPRAFPALLPAPFGDARMISRQQHVGHAVALPLDRAGVMRILRRAPERLAERLLDGAVHVAERVRKLAYHGVADHHRRELTAREDVRADGDDVRGEVLVDP